MLLSEIALCCDDASTVQKTCFPERPILSIIAEEASNPIAGMKDREEQEAK